MIFFGFFMISIVSAKGKCKDLTLVCRQPENKLEKIKKYIIMCDAGWFKKDCQPCEHHANIRYGFRPYYDKIRMCRKYFRLPKTVEAFEEYD